MYDTYYFRIHTDSDIFDVKLRSFRERRLSIDNIIELIEKSDKNEFIQFLQCDNNDPIYIKHSAITIIEVSSTRFPIPKEFKFNQSKGEM